jgi:hypothetical protein
MQKEKVVFVPVEASTEISPMQELFDKYNNLPKLENAWTRRIMDALLKDLKEALSKESDHLSKVKGEAADKELIVQDFTARIEENQSMLEMAILHSDQRMVLVLKSRIIELKQGLSKF